MKLKQMTRRIIAVVLSISMLLTVLPANCSVAFAESENSSKTILASLSDEISSMGEASAEAFADSTAEASVRAGDWRTAIYKDHLAWNLHARLAKGATHNSTATTVVLGKYNKEKIYFIS